MKIKATFTSLLVLIFILTAFVYAPKNHITITGDTLKQTSIYNPTATIPASDWTTGAMPDTTGSGTPTTAILQQLLIPNTSLKPMNIVAGGPNILVSNNPERFTGDGWLMQHNRVDPTQGGVDYPLTGTTKIYLFHLNYTSPAATKYIHLIMHNTGASSITYSAKGSYYTNAAGEKPLTGIGTGQSYWVSKDWLTNTFRTNITAATIPAGGKEEIFKIQMNGGNMADGLFEVTTSGPVYYYTIVTSTGVTNTAKSATSGSYASFAAPPDPRVTQSDYRMETGGTYARQAGVYTASEVTADNILDVPHVPSRIGFCFNTAAKFYPMLEEQTSPIVVKTPPTTDSVRLKSASSRSYGNYGNRYNVLFRLQNTSTTTKTVNVYFAANTNLVDAAASNATWNSQFKINSTFVNVYTQKNNPRKLLTTLTVPTGTTNANIEVYIPGLITTNHQLIFETITTALVPLPVSLTNFSGNNTGNYNNLNWHVEQEDKLSHYELQKAADGNIFTTIKNIPSKNNTTAYSYTYKDAIAENFSGTNYYRLKIIDTDGKYTYSKTIAITAKSGQSFKVTDNFFTNQFTVKYYTQQRQLTSLKLYNGQGKLIQSRQVNSSSGACSYTFTGLKDIVAGVYVFEIIIDNKRLTQKVIKIN
jgi:hypothetical protein